MTVTVNDQALTRAINKLSHHLGDSFVAMDLIGQLMQRYVQDTIRAGGRKRPYAPLSPWTVRRTGRTRPLITLVDRFAYSASRDTATIYFMPPAGKNFSIDKHHRGFSIPARVGNPVMVIPFAAGGAAFLRKAKRSKIPAREVWPTQSETSSYVKRAARFWVQQGVQQWQ